MISPTAGGDHAFNGFGATKLGCIGKVGANFGRGWNDAGCIQRQAPKKFQIAGDCGGSRVFRFQTRTNEPVNIVIHGQASLQSGHYGTGNVQQVSSNLIVTSFPFRSYGCAGKTTAHDIGSIVTLVDSNHVTVPCLIGQVRC